MNLKSHLNPSRFASVRWPAPVAGLLLLGGCLGLATVPARGGTWTRVASQAPDYISMMLLLPNGTVMAHGEQSSNWYLLTPSATGSYASGTWTALPAMHDTRLYFASDVLRDGRVLVAGGEYGSGGATAEVYDMVASTWTVVTPPASLLNPSKASPEVGENQGFFDATSEVISNGMVLVAPVGDILKRRLQSPEQRLSA